MVTVGVSLLPEFAVLQPQPDAEERQTLPHALAQRWSHERSVHVLIDGAKIVSLAELLDTADVAHMCLFDGELDSITAGAPWLVTLPNDHRLMRALFTAEGQPHLALWPMEATLFIESDIPLAGLRAHFRRFLRVRDAVGKAYFFRFWEASTSPAYFKAIADSPDLITRWFCPREGGRISAFLVPDAQAAAMHVIAPSGLPDQPLPATGQFVLRDGDHVALAHARLDRDIAGLIALLSSTFPDHISKMKGHEQDAFARRTVSRMNDYGMVQQDHLFSLLAWELHYGPGFENRDPEGILRQLCEAPLPEGEKFALLAERVATFE